MLELFLNLIDSEESKSKFEKIYNKYHSFMLKLASSITGDHYDAEDAIQNVLFIIAKNIDKIDTEDEHKLKSFFRVVVKNASIDLLRKREKERFSSIDEEVIEDKDTLIKIENKEIYNTVIERVISMPNSYRSVLVLSLIHELTPKEISETLSIPLNTVYTRLKRGKQLLTKIIGDLYDKN